MQGLGPLAALGFVVTLLEPRNQMSYQSFNSELRFKLSKPPDPSTFDRNSPTWLFSPYMYRILYAGGFQVPPLDDRSKFPLQGCLLTLSGLSGKVSR
jgi:hypothetical protein